MMRGLFIGIWLVLSVQGIQAQLLSSKATEQLRQWGLTHVIEHPSIQKTERIVAVWDSLYPAHKDIVFNLMTEKEWQWVLESGYFYATKEKLDSLYFKIAFPLAAVYHTQSMFAKGLPLFEYLYKNKRRLDPSHYEMVLIKLEEEYRGTNDMQHALEIRNERVAKGFIRTYWALYAECSLWKEAIEDYLFFEPKPQENGVDLMKYYWFLGDLYVHAKRYDSAMYYYQQGSKEAVIYHKSKLLSSTIDQENARYLVANFSGLIGKCYVQQGQCDKAMPYLEEDLHYSKGRYKVRTWITLAECFLQQGALTKAKNNLDSSRAYLDGRSVHEVELQFFKMMALYYEKAHRFDSSIYYLKAYHSAEDAWDENMRKNQTSFLLARMEVQKRRAELAGSKVALEHAQLNSRYQQRQLFLLMVGLFTAIVIVMLLYWNIVQRDKAKRSIEMQHAQLKQSSQRVLEESARNATLLRELHHRVKNNLQIIYSLISLQKRRVALPEAVQLLDAIQTRIHSMALVHERLYAADDMEQVAVGQYIESLVDHLAQIYKTDEKEIHIELEMDDVQLPLSKAIPVGLIVNEAVSNAFKHAFDVCKQGTIWVSFREQKGFCKLEIRDDGCQSGVIPNDQPHLGLKIIKTMSDQLLADYQFSTRKGFIHSIKFELDPYEYEENSDT